jgi:plastocyanin
MPHEQVRGHLRAYVILVVLLVALGGFAYAVFLLSGAGVPSSLIQQAQEISNAPKGFPQGAPAPTAQDAVVAQQGFNYVVAYTDTGFRPASLSVKKGQVIRFTNISGGPIQIIAGSETSPSLAHAQYWEYTAATSGTLQVESSAGQSLGLTIK